MFGREFGALKEDSESVWFLDEDNLLRLGWFFGFGLFLLRTFFKSGFGSVWSQAGASLGGACSWA